MQSGANVNDSDSSGDDRPSNVAMVNTSPTADTIVGDALLGGRWRLDAPIGSGGMGEVWRAHHDALGRVAAIKVVRSAHANDRGRLLQEAQVLASIRHPAVVEVFDCGEHAGFGFYVMELLEGRTLGARLRSQGPMTPRAAVDLLVPILDGLDAAHAAGVIHRDVKPENVFLVKTPSGEQAKLIDFGIARVRGSSPRWTVAGELIGTPDYMAPEQLHGGEPDARTDVWAIGATVYEAIVGKAPFEADDFAATLHRVLHEPPPRIVKPPVDEALWLLLCRALAKSAAARFPTASSFADHLRAWSRGADRGAAAVARTQPSLADAPSPDPLRGSLDALLRGKLTPK